MTDLDLHARYDESSRADLAKQENSKLQFKYIPGNSPLRGGGDRGADNQQIIGPEPDELGEDGEGNILDGLPKEERKRLIKVRAPNCCPNPIPLS